MHDKCLRVVYNGNTSSYEEFLEIDTYVSGDHRNKFIQQHYFIQLSCIK